MVGSLRSGGAGLVPVSVVVPAFQASQTIAAALHSVLHQSAIPREVIVVDDGSDDVEALEETIRGCSSSTPVPVRLHRSTVNRGPAAARNTGWNLASDDSAYVAFLDADDSWEPDKLMHQVSWMRNHPHVAWTAHRCTVGHGGWPGGHRSGCRRLNRSRLLTANPVATPTVLIERRVPTRFREALRYCEDLMLWLDLLDEGFPGVILAESFATLGRKPITKGGLTGNLVGMHAGYLDVLDVMAREGRLSTPDVALLRLWEHLRYVRRMACRLLG